MRKYYSDLDRLHDAFPPSYDRDVPGLVDDLGEEMSEMTPEEIQQVRERCEKALAALDRPPPWVWWVDKAGEMRLQTVGRGWQIILDVVRRGMQGAGLRWQDHKRGIMRPVVEWIDGDGHFTHPDAEYIEVAVNAVPALLAHLASLEARNEAMAAVIAAARDLIDPTWWERGNRVDRYPSESRIHALRAALDAQAGEVTG